MISSIVLTIRNVRFYEIEQNDSKSSEDKHVFFPITSLILFIIQDQIKKIFHPSQLPFTLEKEVDKWKIMHIVMMMLIAMR